MKIFVPVVVASATFSSSSASTAWIQALTPINNSDSYHMSYVHMVHARAQSDAPVWVSTLGTGAFASSHGSTPETQFRAALDTVNTASVEGALMYVQAEGIDYSKRGTTDDAKCNRKNWMQYIVFYDIVFAQTNETLAEYGNEYGPFMAMDGGQCTPVNGTFSKECVSLNGNATLGVPGIGPFVGGEPRTNDTRAPYPDCWWYSFPNNCPESKWRDKTDACRASTRKGLCDFDKLPDGVTCTFNYRILGYVPIDDVVGITSMKNLTTGVEYANFSDFCLDGGVEFETDSKGNVVNIPFWADPLVTTANTARSKTLIETYASMLSSKTSKQITSDVIIHMTSLPVVADLTTENPPCYKNIKECADATHGCKRDLFGQICTVCTANDNGCETAPSSFTFPTLAKATVVSTTTSSSTGSSGTADASTPTPTPTAATASTTSAAANVALTIGALVASIGLSFVMA